MLTLFGGNNAIPAHRRVPLGGGPALSRVGLPEELGPRAVSPAGRDERDRRGEPITRGRGSPEARVPQNRSR